MTSVLSQADLTSDKSGDAADRELHRERAVALHYPEEESAPRVLASGAGEVARQILAIAAQHNVPIHKDAELVELLSHLPEGARVPEVTYDLIAEIVCFLYGLDVEAA